MSYQPTQEHKGNIRKSLEQAWIKGLYKNRKPKLRTRYPWNKGKKLPQMSGQNHPMFGKHLTEQTKEKMRKSLRGRISWNTGLTKEKDERVAKLADVKRGKSRDAETRKVMKATQFKKGHTTWNKGKKMPSELIKKCLRRRIPSSLEEKFQHIVDEHSLPYKYVGNGSFIVGNCNPDFINTNSEKIAIEVYAKYYKNKNHHSIEQWKVDRAKIFQEFGWEVLYFDETEVNEDNVLSILGGELN